MRLTDARTILLVDWPSREVPDTLAQLGWTVIAQEGPDRYVAYDLETETVTPRPRARAPERADLVYMFRPLDELEGVVELARSLGARTVWLETEPAADEMAATRATIEAADMTMASGSIVEAARALRS